MSDDIRVIEGDADVFTDEPQARYAAPSAGRACRRCNEPLEAHETILCWACQMDLDSRNKVTVAAPRLFAKTS